MCSLNSNHFVPQIRSSIWLTGEVPSLRKKNFIYPRTWHVTCYVIDYMGNPASLDWPQALTLCRGQPGQESTWWHLLIRAWYISFTCTRIKIWQFWVWVHCGNTNISSPLCPFVCPPQIGHVCIIISSYLLPNLWDECKYSMFMQGTELGGTQITRFTR